MILWKITKSIVDVSLEAIVIVLVKSSLFSFSRVHFNYCNGIKSKDPRV